MKNASENMKLLTVPTFLSSLAVLSYSFPVKNVPNPVDAKCMALHCPKSGAVCFTDKVCSENIGCVSKCWGMWDSDTTPGKDHVQNCTSRCTFSYEDDVYDKFIGCLASYDCIKFPPIPNLCKGPSNIKIQKNISLSEMEGEWWVLRGHNPVYDCFPCQRNSIHKINSTAWTYKPSYQVYLVNGTLKFVGQSGALVDNAPQPGFNISLMDAGLVNHQTWWVFDRIDDATSGNSYYLIYYCGNSLQWNFQGAIVYSKTPTLVDSVAPAIAASFKANAGLDYSSFCSPSVSGCPDKL